MAEVPGLKRSPWTNLKAGLAQRLGWLWKPALCAGALGGFLLGRGIPGVGLAPLGIAFFAATRGAGFGAVKALPVLAAVIVGAGTVLPLSQVLWIAAALSLCHMAASVLRLGRKQPSPVAAAILAAAAVLLPGIMLGPRLGIETLIFWAGVTGVLALVFTLGIHDVTSRKLMLNVSPDSPVPAIVLVASALSGLEGIALFGRIPLRDVAAGLMVMMCSYAGGPPMGSAAGAVVGFSFLVDGFGGHSAATLVGVLPESRAMAYVAAGLLAGTFRELGRLGVGVAFCLGWITIFFSMASISNTAVLLALAYSAVAATLVYWLIPLRWTANLPTALVTTGEVAPAAPAQSAANVGAMIERTRSLSRAFKEIGKAFEQVAAVETATTDDHDRAFEQVTQRVCRSCALFDQCWQREPGKTYRLFTDLWGQIDEGGHLQVHPVPEELERHCVYSSQVAFTLNYLHDLHRSQSTWKRRLGDGRTAVGEYVRNASHMLDRFADDIAEPPPKGQLSGIPVLRVVTGVARLPKRGGFISGDSYADAMIGSERHLLALSDGMGVGQDAAADSKRCLILLQEVLQAGFNPDVAVKTVNSALLVRSTEESFATVDMLLFELASGRAEFVKVGAAPSFVKRRAGVTVIKSASVPAGIVNQVQVEPEYRTLHPDDIVVMITDGIWDLSKEEEDKERWIIEHLTREPSTDPEEIAESLLAKALERMSDAGDDMTILVARIDALSRIGERGPRHRSSGWVPAKAVGRGGGNVMGGDSTEGVS